MTLALSGGTKKPGPNAVGRMTAIELVLDICAPQSQCHHRAGAAAAGAGGDAPHRRPTSSFSGGRFPFRTTAKIQERAMLMVQPVKTTVSQP